MGWMHGCAGAWVGVHWWICMDVNRISTCLFTPSDSHTPSPHLLAPPTHPRLPSPLPPSPPPPLGEGPRNARSQRCPSAAPDASTPTPAATPTPCVGGGCEACRCDGPAWDGVGTGAGEGEGREAVQRAAVLAGPAGADLGGARVPGVRVAGVRGVRVGAAAGVEGRGGWGARDCVCDGADADAGCGCDARARLAVPFAAPSPPGRFFAPWRSPAAVPPPVAGSTPADSRR